MTTRKKRPFLSTYMRSMVGRMEKGKMAHPRVHLFRFLTQSLSDDLTCLTLTQKDHPFLTGSVLVEQISTSRCRGYCLKTDNSQNKWSRSPDEIDFGSVYSGQVCSRPVKIKASKLSDVTISSSLYGVIFFEGDRQEISLKGTDECRVFFRPDRPGCQEKYI